MCGLYVSVYLIYILSKPIYILQSLMLSEGHRTLLPQCCYFSMVYFEGVAWLE